MGPRRRLRSDAVIQDALDYLTDSGSWWGRNGLVNLTWNHMRLSGAAVLAAVVAAIPPALYLGHHRRGGFFAITLVNLSRALPTFAVIAFVFPLSLQYGFGLGFWPTFVALFLLALPPIFVNAYTGVSEIDRDVVEAARAMGMQEREVLRRVELPAAMPLLVTGIRVSAVQVVATTTLGALVGFRCLGTPILQAIATRNDGQLIVAALVVAALSLLTEAVLGLVGRRLTPWASTRATEAKASVQHAT
jgi:osmoprotectant transport system permease protein